MEEVSGANLNEFFQQWIFTEGYPSIEWDWSYENGKVMVRIEQTQNHHIFNFPLEIEIMEKGKSIISTVQVSDKKSSFEIAVDSRPTAIRLDPNVKLLFEEM